MNGPGMQELRSRISGERALAAVQEIARFHRVQASPGYDDAADWMARAVERLGVTPEIEWVPGDGTTRFLGWLMPDGWECVRAWAALIDGDRRETACDYEACRLSLVLRSAPAHGRFPVVALEDGTEDRDYEGIDVRGRVVLTRGAVHRVHTLAVVERGAAGIVCDGRRLFPPVRDRWDDPEQRAYTSFWWSGDEPRGWGFVISPRMGEEWRARLAAGRALELEVEVESRRFPTRLPLLSARVPGSGPDEVLIMAHLCHPQPSANDNASGAAAALEALRALAPLAREGWRPARGVRFLWVPELTGSYAWLAQDEARAARVTAALNLDMVGQDQERCGSTFFLERPPCFAASFAEHLARAVRRDALDLKPSSSSGANAPLARLGEAPYGGGSDHALFNDPAVGVPCPMLIQWPDRFYHSSHDTPDKCDPASLALAARCAAGYGARLASLDARGADALLARVERRARIDLLRSADEDESGWRAARARLAGERALASLERLGAAPAAVAGARTRFDEFADRESGAPRPSRVDGGAEFARVPRRSVAAPLDSQRHRVAGAERESRANRERLRALERRTPDAALRFDLAWQACDGRRDLGAIADLVALETGRETRAEIAEFFEWAEGRGLLLEWC